MRESGEKLRFENTHCLHPWDEHIYKINNVAPIANVIELRC